MLTGSWFLNLNKVFDHGFQVPDVSQRRSSQCGQEYTSTPGYVYSLGRSTRQKRQKQSITANQGPGRGTFFEGLGL